MLFTDLALHPNEASDLAPVLDEPGLVQLGWDRAFVTVLDEVPGDQCLAVLGHEAGAAVEEGWSVKRVPTRPGKAAGKTEDAEAAALHDGCVYVLGSQFGKKRGPLNASRSWIGRVREAELGAWLQDRKVRSPRMEIVRLRFSLHRAVNDALARSAVALQEPGPLTAVRYVDQTLRRGVAEDKRWKDELHAGDVPINVEGAAFRPDGRLLLGLRYPVTTTGAPVLVELTNVEAVLAGERPACGTVWSLEGVGSVEQPTGVRAIHPVGPDRFQAIVGNLDAIDKRSTIVEDDPRAGRSPSVHVAFELPALASGGAVRAQVLHRFGALTRVEGLALWGDHAHYVVDEDGHLGLHSLLVTEMSR